MQPSPKTSAFTSPSSVTTSSPNPSPAEGELGASPPKAWYASAGVWGALVTLAGSVLALLKVEVDPALLADVREWVLAAATLVGGGVALWGRLRASRRIGAPAEDAPRPPTRPPTPPPTLPPTLPPPASAVGLRVRVLLLAVLVAPPLVTLAGGCAPLVGASGPYVAADRATFDAIAPEYRDYVDADPSLSAEQRERRKRTLDLWRVRLEDAEGRRLSPHAGAERKRGDERSAAPDTSAHFPKTCSAADPPRHPEAARRRGISEEPRVIHPGIPQSLSLHRDDVGNRSPHPAPPHDGHRTTPSRDL